MSVFFVEVEPNSVHEYKGDGSKPSSFKQKFLLFTSSSKRADEFETYYDSRESLPQPGFYLLSAEAGAKVFAPFASSGGKYINYRFDPRAVKLVPLADALAELSALLPAASPSKARVAAA